MNTEAVMLVVASGNAHKAREIAAMLGDVSVCVRTMREAGFDRTIAEDGESFEENARIKCREMMRFLKGTPGVWVLADDSGLEVDALDGRPGVYSARYAGEPSNDHANTSKLLCEMRGVPGPGRTARFRCVLAVGKSDAAGEAGIHVLDGACPGKIGFRPKGENGFGYDSVFFPDGFCRTFAELGEVGKNKISHRSAAMRKFREWWAKQKG